MRNFIGRETDRHKLEKIWQGTKTSIVSIYGRRRVGKTALIHHFSQGKKAYLFEALEGADTQKQIQHFLRQLSHITGETYLQDLNYTQWEQVFDLLTQKIQQEKSLILSFDELAWMAVGRSQLVSIIKYYWDKHWKSHAQLMLILCGSVASWMLKNVVRSNALYGRVSENILLQPLLPQEVHEFIGNRRGQQEVLKYLICFGGIPKYLEEFDYRQSFEINIEQKCFTSSGFFVDEAEKIFYNQFKETHLYQRITKFLLKQSANLQEIADHLKMASSGGLKDYLDNLAAAGIIQPMPVIQDFKPMKKFRYVVWDEFLRFHYQYIQPHLTEIQQSQLKQKRFDKFTQASWNVFLGLAFERFCLKYRYEIAQQLGFADKVMVATSLANLDKHGYQYDLVYLRKDHCITLGEVKFFQKKLGIELIAEFERKLAKTKFPKGYSIERILICNQDPGNAIVKSGYFHQVLNICDLLGNNEPL